MNVKITKFNKMKLRTIFLNIKWGAFISKTHKIQRETKKHHRGHEVIDISHYILI